MVVISKTGYKTFKFSHFEESRVIKKERLLHKNIKLLFE